MRRSVCALFAFTLILIYSGILDRVSADSDEITLYSANGKPVAYIADDDDSTIYLWSGKPVAYLRPEDIYGFNGKHLGWFAKGLVYNHEGEIVGAIRSKLNRQVQLSPVKAIKEIKPIKSIREIKPIRPIFGLSWSEDETLRSFLAAGSDD
jgi:hypothetical protein